MPHILKPILMAAALCALAFACSADAPPGDGGPPAPDAGRDGGVGSLDGGAQVDGGPGLPLESACAVLNERACAYLQRCGLLDADEDAARDCEVFLTVTRCGPTRWPARVMAGTLSYHPSAAFACAQAWDEHACADWQALPLICEDVTTPAASLGGQCYGSLRQECAQGVCTGGTCPRVCRARGGEGELCEDSPDCRDGLYCQRTGNVLGVCAAFGAVGDSCAAERPCAAASFCNALNRCELRVPLGAACSSGTCAQDAYCAVEGPYAGTCVARSAQGGPCGRDEACRQDLLCTQAGTCQPRDLLAGGVTCEARQSCVAGLTCVGTGGQGLGQCQPGRERGATCDVALDCAEPLTCVLGMDGGTCEPRLAVDAPCTSARDCGALAACVQGVCTRLPHPGERCPDRLCLYGACDTETDGGTVCRGPGGPNAVCADHEDCASLRCASGRCLAACTP